MHQEDAFGWVGSSHQWGVVSVGNELVLPNGNRLGHRSLAKFCKQKYEHMSHGANTSVKTNRNEAYERLLADCALQKANDAVNGALVKSSAWAKGKSKAIASTFIYKAGAADNARARALVHHGYGMDGGGSHYWLAASKQFQKGVRVKGVISRHSVQGAKMQATRNKKNRADSSIAVMRSN